MKEKENFSKSLFKYTDKEQSTKNDENDSDIDDFEPPPLPKKKKDKKN